MKRRLLCLLLALAMLVSLTGCGNRNKRTAEGNTSSFRSTQKLHKPPKRQRLFLPPKNQTTTTMTQKGKDGTSATQQSDSNVALEKKLSNKAVSYDQKYKAFQKSMDKLKGKSYVLQMDTDIDLQASQRGRRESARAQVQLTANVRKSGTKRMEMSGSCTFTVPNRTMAYTFYQNKQTTSVEYTSPVLRMVQLDKLPSESMLHPWLEIEAQDVRYAESSEEGVVLVTDASVLNLKALLKDLVNEFDSVSCDEVEMQLWQDKKGRPSELILFYTVEFTKGDMRATAAYEQTLSFSSYGRAKVRKLSEGKSEKEKRKKKLDDSADKKAGDDADDADDGETILYLDQYLEVTDEMDTTVEPEKDTKKKKWPADVEDDTKTKDVPVKAEDNSQNNVETAEVEKDGNQSDSSDDDEEHDDWGDSSDDDEEHDDWSDSSYDDEEHGDWSDSSYDDEEDGDQSDSSSDDEEDDDQSDSSSDEEEHDDRSDSSSDDEEDDDRSDSFSDDEEDDDQSDSSSDDEEDDDQDDSGDDSTDSFRRSGTFGDDSESSAEEACREKLAELAEKGSSYTMMRLSGGTVPELIEKDCEGLVYRFYTFNDSSEFGMDEVGELSAENAQLYRNEDGGLIVLYRQDDAAQLKRVFWEDGAIQSELLEEYVPRESDMYDTIEDWESEKEAYLYQLLELVPATDTSLMERAFAEGEDEEQELEEDPEMSDVLDD